MAITVTNDNFVRAETDRMFASLQRATPGVNHFGHLRAPTPVDEQTVVRMNRDTLYSMAVVDISGGATLTVPDAGHRYLSVMVVNQDHFINRIFHEPGDYQLSVEESDTPYVLLAARVLVDPADPGDVATVNAIQDRFSVTGISNRTFEMPDYDEASFTTTREAVQEEGRQGVGLKETYGVFGKRSEIDPDRHRIGTAIGWGGLPIYEAMYVAEEPHLPVGAYSITAQDVPVDAFWSITVYNKEGFFEENPFGAYNINNITAKRNDDDSITVHLGGDETQPNHLPITEGWNYIVRLYRPRPEVLDGTWTFPSLDTVS